MLPLQVLAPVALDDPAAIVSVLNPTGGLVGGDRLAIDVTVGAAAHACFTTPSATKVYRATAEPAAQDVALRLEAGAVCEWVPDHTIPFAGSALRQRITVDVGDGACLILVDAFAAGRVGRGEAWAFRLLDSAITLRDAKGWLLRDRFVLEGGGVLDPRALGAAEGRPYFATLVVVVLMVQAGAGLIRDSGRIFLEAAPAGLDPAAVGAAMAIRPHVAEVHDLHIWEITSGLPAASAHVLVAPGEDCHAVRADLEAFLSREYGITHATLQVDHAGLPVAPGVIGVSEQHCDDAHGPAYRPGDGR